MNFRPRHISEDELREMKNRVRGQVKGLAVGGVSAAQKMGKPTPSPQFRSKWEAAYASKLELEKQAGIIKAYWYEPFSLWLPGKVRYKPDFLVQHNLRFAQDKIQALELIEVKGWSKNRRDGMTRLKIAAALFPCFVWRLVYRQGNGWSGEYV